MDTVSDSVQKDNPYTIYALVDPRDFLPHYVGFSLHPEDRLLAHLRRLIGQNPDKEMWIEELLALRLAPRLQPLEKVATAYEARKREIYWVQYYTKKGIVLSNILINRVAYQLFSRLSQDDFSPVYSSEDHVSYQLQYRRCSKPACSRCRGQKGHGPYWYAYWREEDGKVHSRYIGKAYSKIEQPLW